MCETARAIDAAYKAQKLWAAKTGKERAGILRKLFDVLVANADDLATILTMEMGKPLAEAKGEVLYGASCVSGSAKRPSVSMVKPYRPSAGQAHHRDHAAGRRRGPITPWSFPNAMLARKFAPAAAAGCAMVSKLAAETPLSALALAVLTERAGLPAGIFNIVLSKDSASIGKEFTENDKERKLTFTGSTNVGKILMRQGAEQIIKPGLDLGGNASFIVFDDADIDAAVEDAMISKYRNNGQTCVWANRLYVQSGVNAGPLSTAKAMEKGRSTSKTPSPRVHPLHLAESQISVAACSSSRPF